MRILSPSQPILLPLLTYPGFSLFLPPYHNLSWPTCSGRACPERKSPMALTFLPDRRVAPPNLLNTVTLTLLTRRRTRSNTLAIIMADGSRPSAVSKPQLPARPPAQQHALPARPPLVHPLPARPSGSTASALYSGKGERVSAASYASSFQEYLRNNNVAPCKSMISTSPAQKVSDSYSSLWSVNAFSTYISYLPFSSACSIDITNFHIFGINILSAHSNISPAASARCIKNSNEYAFAIAAW
jgi:hypothetical protein